MAIGSTIGFYIAYLGSRSLGTGIFANGVGTGNFMELAIFVAPLGLVLIVILTAYRVKGAILTGIITATVMGTPLGVTTLPDAFIKTPDSSSWGNIVLSLDFKGLLSFQAVIYVFVALCGDFFSTLGAMLRTVGEVGMLDEDGNIPEMPTSILKVL